MTFYNSKNHKVEAWQITENIDSPAPSFVTKALLTGMVAPVNAIGGCRGKLHQLRVMSGLSSGESASLILEIGLSILSTAWV